MLRREDGKRFEKQFDWRCQRRCPQIRWMRLKMGWFGWLSRRTHGTRETLASVRSAAMLSISRVD